MRKNDPSSLAFVEYAENTVLQAWASPDISSEQIGIDDDQLYAIGDKSMM